MVKVEALDYLLKPFDYAEFLTAVNKSNKWFSLVKGAKKSCNFRRKRKSVFICKIGIQTSTHKIS